MQKITPHLWFDKEAREAAGFYTWVFPDSRVLHTTRLHDTPSGDTDVVSFEIWGHKFTAISAGPLFKFNPAISFMINFDPLFFKRSSSPQDEARRKLGEVWAKLVDHGEVLMPLDQYSFSERYGWVKDKFGVTWQLILGKPDGDPRPAVIPSLMFVGDVAGKAEEAINFYGSVFKDSKMGLSYKYDANQKPNKEGTIMFADFMLEKQWFAAMDSAHEHDFGFNEAISFAVECKTQKEIDYYWDKLSAVRESEQCGWIKDKYGLSWQIVPEVMERMVHDDDPERVARVTQAFLQMKKFDLAELERAYAGTLEV